MKTEQFVPRAPIMAFAKLNRGGPLSSPKGKKAYDRKKVKAEDRRRKS